MMKKRKKKDHLHKASGLPACLVDIFGQNAHFYTNHIACGAVSTIGISRFVAVTVQEVAPRSNVVGFSNTAPY